MAHVTRYYISDILEDVCANVTDVSRNVFPEHRPSTTQKQMEDMVVVSLPVLWDDQNAYQSTTMRFELMARNRANGVSYTKRLQEMTDILMEKFPLKGVRYSVTKPRVVMKGDDGLGFTVWFVQARLIVNTTDSYTNEL